MVRRRVVFRGVVQGVFFRDTVRQIAERYAVAGFVRNVATDLVELQAEGEAAVVDAFLADVIANPPPAALVNDVQTTDAQPTGDAGFRVAHTVGR
jgi:acylphosphatase